MSFSAFGEVSTYTSPHPAKVRHRGTHFVRWSMRARMSATKHSGEHTSSWMRSTIVNSCFAERRQNRLIRPNGRRAAQPVDWLRLSALRLALQNCQCRRPFVRNSMKMPRFRKSCNRKVDETSLPILQVSLESGTITNMLNRVPARFLHDAKGPRPYAQSEGLFRPWLERRAD